MNPRLGRPADMGRGEFRTVEIPASNGIGKVRSIARACSVFATGGRELGLLRDTDDTLAAPAVLPRGGPLDPMLRVEVSYQLGYMKPFPSLCFGSSNRAYGTPGWEGSFGFADPDEQVGFACAPNRSGFYLWDDPREKALREAFNRCLARRRQISGTPGAEPTRARL